MIQEFLNYQATNKGLSTLTLEGYAKDLKVFVKYAQAHGLRWSTIDREDIDNYVREEVERGMKPRTIKKRVEVVRLLFTYANHKGLLTDNPARYTQVPKVGEELPKAADDEQLITYLSRPATTRQGYIIHAIVALILETGMRIGEITSMRGEDIDTNNRAILVHGKGSKERYVYYSRLSEEYVKAMSYRKGLIFTDTQINYRYMMYAELPGIHPHAIRHTFAVNQLNRGMDLKTLSTLMGHKHVQTTEIYTHMLTDNVRMQYQRIN